MLSKGVLTHAVRIKVESLKHHYPLGIRIGHERMAGLLWANEGPPKTGEFHDGPA